MSRALGALALIVTLAIAPAAIAAPMAASGAGGLGTPTDSQPMASGVGKSHLGATIGFAAHADLHGEIEYNDGTLNVHCQDLHGYFTHVTDKGFNDAVFGSYNCTDPAGNVYRVWIDAIDHGEPGTNDKLAIRILDANGTLLVNDRGYIQNGNIQVKI